jgi:hypothetical protein
MPAQEDRLPGYDEPDRDELTRPLSLSGITSSNWHTRADEFVAAVPWLAAYIAGLPSEDDGA